MSDTMEITERARASARGMIMAGVAKAVAEFRERHLLDDQRLQFRIEAGELQPSPVREIILR